MVISTFEIKICSQKLCAQNDGFRKSSHIYDYFFSINIRLCSMHFLNEEITWLI